jgi:hypothetical protein
MQASGRPNSDRASEPAVHAHVKRAGTPAGIAATPSCERAHHSLGVNSSTRARNVPSPATAADRDVRHVGIARPGRRLGEPRRDVRVRVASGTECGTPSGSRCGSTSRPFEAGIGLRPVLKKYDVDAIAFDQPLPFGLRSDRRGWKGAREIAGVRWFRRNARIVQNDRLDAEQRTRMEGIIEYRDDHATLVDSTAVETHLDAGPRLRRRSTRARMRVIDE